MRRKVQIFISSLLLFFIISTAYSQNIISRLTLDSTINIATINFEAPLVIQLKIPKEQTSVTLKVSFPEGINYSRIEVPQQEKTLVKVEKTTDSKINHPVFVVTAKPQSVVIFLVYRKFSKCVKANVNYNDVVEAMIGRKTIEKSTSVPYQFRFPKLSIVTEPIEVGKKGENRRGFSVKNLGEGAIKEFYLSVQYPDNIKNKALYYKKNGEDHLLVPESIVPKELANKGRYFYKVNVGVLKKESVIGVSFSEIYEITNCFSSTPIQYQVYWGSDFTTEGLFETSKITEKIVSNYTVSNLLSYQEGKIGGETTDEVVYKGKITINSIDRTIQTGEKSYFKVQLPVGITPVFSLGDLKNVAPLSQNVTEYTFLLPQGKKKNDSFDYTLKLQTNRKLTFVPSSKMVYYTTEESGRETCTATPLYTSIKKEITIPIEETLLYPIKLQTTDDTFSHTTTTQTIVLGNILTNDSYNTQSVTTASVTISTTTALTNIPYIATATGEVFLPAQTPAGTYTLTYSLCAKTAPYNCSEVATITVIVSPSPIKLQTTDDTFSHTTTTQTIVLGNILTNDSYNSQSVTTTSVTISTTTTSTNVPYIATATGEVFLPAHTPAGTYTLTYRLCAKTPPYNCSEVATVTIIVSPSPIKLQTIDDIFSHTTTTQTIVLGNILTNDSYNTQSVTTASVTISTTTTLTNVPYIATSTGEVLLPAHTLAGTYTLTYSLCAKTAPYNRSGVATVTIIVNPSPIKLQTTNDTFSHTTTTQTIVLGNILTNDSYNTQSVTTASVTISTTTASTNVPYIATATGEVFLPAYTPAGTYTLTYSLCAKTPPYNCSEVATVTVIVSPSPIKIQTTNDTFSHATTTQTIVLGNVLINDSYNSQSVTTASVTISTTTALTNLPYIATATGEVFLPAHTPAGTYTLIYSLCAKTAPYNCSEVATITIIVSPSPIKLQTTDDTFSHTTTTQTIVLGNILTNDSYNAQSVTTASVTISTTTALTNLPYIATATGEVFLPAHTPSGTYTLSYSLCTKSAPYNCSGVATVTVIVSPSPIKLQTTDDTFSHTTTTQTIVLGNILINDSYNSQSVTTTSVTISTTTALTNVPYIEITIGEVFLPAHTPAGTYTLTYSLCAKTPPYNCSEVATVTIIVSPYPIKLQTTDDTFSHTTTTQTIVLGNVLTNDSYNAQSVTTASVTISTTTTSTNTPYIATSTGEVFLPAHTPAGTYTLTYSLCAKTAPYNCSGVATVTIIVSPYPIKLQTTDDTFSHTTTTQTIVLGNVLTNDSYNTQSVTTASVTISTTTTLTNVPYIATATGEVFLPAHTPAGTYTLSYSLCAKVAPYNCSEVATVTIIVSPSPIKLQTTNDTFSHTTTTQTIVLGNILTNDSYNSQSVTTASVTISTTTTLTNVPYIATATGEVFLPAHTPAGTYTLSYSLCAKVAPYNCSEVATVTIIVSPSPIKLQTTNDTFSHTTTTQTIVLGNVLTNDSYNTQSVTTASVTISTTTTLTNVPYIATSTGEVLLPAHTLVGTYTLTYSLCTKTPPYNCSEVATVTIIVSSPLVIARDDTYTITIGTTTITESIYSNDSIGEQTPNASLVNFQSIGGSKDSDNFYVLSVNLAGNVLIPQGTPTGTYTLQYRICDVKDSHNCATATITVMVTEIPTPLIIARDDTYTVTIGTTTITESIYSNDSIGEQIPNTSLVNFQSIGGSKDSDNFYVLSVNLAGNVLIPQGTPIGTYTLEYRICDIHHQSNCDTAIVKVSITSPPVPPSTLVVTPDKFTYTGNAIVGNILDNDTIDDNPIELPNDDVNIEAEEPTDTAPYIETSTGNVIVPTHTPAGTYTLNYELCIENLTICDATTVEVIVPDNPTPPAPPKPQEDETVSPTNVLIPYNAISLNDDNKNDYFHIEGIEKYPDNIVRIYNKEGLKVFEVTGYDNKNQSFKGFTQGEVAVKKSLELPVGTYFYFIEYTDENHQLQRKTGWLYLKK